MRISDWSSDVCSSDLATSAVPLDGTRAAVRTRETNLGNLVADSLLWQGRQLAGSFGLDQPVIALQNGGGICNDAVIPADPVSRAAALPIMPFDNFVGLAEGLPADTLRLAMSRGGKGGLRYCQFRCTEESQQKKKKI